MKKMIVSFIVVMAISSTAMADVRIEVVTPIEAAKSVESFVKDTGKKVCEGVTATVFGLGDIITAPFRADVYRPKKKVYYYRRPLIRFDYQRGKLYEKNR